MNPLRRAPLVLSLLALCTACTLTPKRGALPTTLAFPAPAGVGRATPTIPPLVLFPVRAPSWLATRLLYVRRSGGLTIRTHRRAVWIASLPGILSGALRESLIPHERAGTARIALHVRLFDLEETLTGARAHVLMEARTRLSSLLPGVPDRVRLWRLAARTGPGARAEARAIVALDKRFNADVLRWIVRSTAVPGRPADRPSR